MSTVPSKCRDVTGLYDIRQCVAVVATEMFGLDEVEPGRGSLGVLFDDSTAKNKGFVKSPLLKQLEGIGFLPVENLEGALGAGAALPADVASKQLRVAWMGFLSFHVAPSVIQPHSGQR